MSVGAGPDTTASLGSVMESAERAHPLTKHVFIGEAGIEHYTLEEINGRAHALARALQARGVGAGDTLAIQTPNWPEAMIALRAAYALGVTVVPIAHNYRRLETLFILRDTGAKVLITAAKWRSIEYSEHFEAALEQPHLELIVTVRSSAPGSITFEALEEEGQRIGHQRVMAPRHVGTRDVAFLIYTSGSTALPKGTLHSHGGFLFEMRQAYCGTRLNHGTYLDALPYGHLTGWMAVSRALMFGQPSVVVDHWDANAALDAVRSFGAETSILPPFHLRTLLDASEEAKLPVKMREVASGSTTVEPSLVEEACAKGVPAYRVYGSSEHPTVSIGRLEASIRERSYTDGPLADGCDVRVVDESDEALPDGEEGEVWSRGPDMFMGYTDKAATEEAITPDGWYRSGDLGTLLNGILTITGRKKDLIIRGGENLSPKEIEDVLVTHASVIQAAVVGKPDPRYGERAWAFVTTRNGANLTLEEIRAHFRASGIAIQKTPEGVEVVDDFPRTPAGKIRKNDLRTRFKPQ